jgi:hypothetical protein
LPCPRLPLLDPQAFDMIMEAESSTWTSSTTARQHNSTRLRYILDSGRLDDFVTVWMVPAGITKSGCKVGPRIRRWTVDRQRRWEGRSSEDWDRSLGGATVSRLPDDEGQECNRGIGRSVSKLGADGLSLKRIGDQIRGWRTASRSADCRISGQNGRPPRTQEPRRPWRPNTQTARLGRPSESSNRSLKTASFCC